MRVFWITINNLLWKTAGWSSCGANLVKALGYTGFDQNFAGSILIENSAFESRRKEETRHLWIDALHQYIDDTSTLDFVVRCLSQTEYPEIIPVLESLYKYDHVEPSTQGEVVKSLKMIKDRINWRQQLKYEKW